MIVRQASIKVVVNKAGYFNQIIHLTVCNMSLLSFILHSHVFLLLLSLQLFNPLGPSHCHLRFRSRDKQRGSLETRSNRPRKLLTAQQ
jgi:hypothetical protein